MQENASLERVDKKLNRMSIEKAFIDIYHETGKHPTNASLSKRTGLDLATIDRHKNGLNFNWILGEIVLPKIKERFPGVVEAMIRQGEKGNVRAAEFLIKLNEYMKTLEGNGSTQMIIETPPVVDWDKDGNIVERIVFTRTRIKDIRKQHPDAIIKYIDTPPPEGFTQVDNADFTEETIEKTEEKG